jgi:hypothetical protein
LQRDEANCGQCGHACAAGEQCFDGECFTVAGTCPFLPDPCAVPMICKPDPMSPCYCRGTFAGELRCGQSAIPSICGECTSDAQCQARLGAGAFCTLCCSGYGICSLPCPND